MAEKYEWQGRLYNSTDEIIQLKSFIEYVGSVAKENDCNNVTVFWSPEYLFGETIHRPTVSLEK